MGFGSNFESIQEEEPKKRCPDCDGTGKVKEYTAVFKEPKSQKDCPRCKGTGEVKR